MNNDEFKIFILTMTFVLTCFFGASFLYKQYKNDTINHYIQNFESGGAIYLLVRGKKYIISKEHGWLYKDDKFVKGEEFFSRKEVYYYQSK